MGTNTCLPALVTALLLGVPALAAADDCHDLRIIERLADLSQSSDSIIDEIRGLRSAVCEFGLEAPRQWKNGITAKSSTGAWNYPNGITARSSTDSWKYPNGITAKSSTGSWKYPNGITARSTGGRWNTPSGISSDSSQLVARACEKNSRLCRSLSRASAHASEMERTLTIIELAWRGR